jgi:hypothetical protein
LAGFAVFGGGGTLSMAASASAGDSGYRLIGFRRSAMGRGYRGLLGSRRESDDRRRALTLGTRALFDAHPHHALEIDERAVNLFRGRAAQAAEAVATQAVSVADEELADPLRHSRS